MQRRTLCFWFSRTHKQQNLVEACLGVDRRVDTQIDSSPGHTATEILASFGGDLACYHPSVRQPAKPSLGGCSAGGTNKCEGVSNTDQRKARQTRASREARVTDRIQCHRLNERGFRSSSCVEPAGCGR
eukprot:scaffold80533_cov57-Phaeocystis_antarctica.AAC.3